MHVKKQNHMSTAVHLQNVYENFGMEIINNSWQAWWNNISLRILHPQNFKKLNKIGTTYSPCFMPFCFNTPANIYHYLIYALSSV